MRLSEDFLKTHAAQPMELFVETGTGLGRSLMTSCGLFDQSLSVEIRKDLFDFNVKLFARIKRNVCLRHDGSVNVIHDEVHGDKSTTFWLDAHYGGDGQAPEVECPLLDELKAISAIKWGKPPVIMIDDAKYFFPEFWDTDKAKPYTREKWPTIEQIKEAAPGFTVEPFKVRGRTKILILREKV